MKRLLIFSIILLFCSGIYGQNEGEITFSKSPINTQQPGSSTTEFKTEDAIYAVAYLPQTVQEMFNAQPNAKLEVEVVIFEIKPPQYSYQQPSEEQLTFGSMWVSGSMLRNKFLVVDLVPDPEKTSAYGTTEITYKEFGKKFDGPVNYAETLSKLQSGEHILKIVVRCNYNDAATGNFKISGEDFSIYKTLSEKLNDVAKDAGAKDAIMPVAQKSDKALEASMVAAFKNSNDWKSGWLNATEVLRINIVDADWYVRRHEISGSILHRYIRAAITVKTKDGSCACYKLVTFQEDYEGGKYMPLKYDGAGELIPINCENVIK
jgi:hypothetical protein